jgi:hypothetical protein
VVHFEVTADITVRDCTLSDGCGRVLHEIKGNHQARRVVVFPEPVTTDRLRLEMPSRQQHAPAAIFEIRAYA